METQTLVAAAAPQTYTCISQLRDGYASVKNHDGWGLIDSTGREIIPCRYPSVDYQGGGLVRICEKQEMFFKLDFDMLDVSCYRIVDMQGNTVISNDDGPITYAYEIDAFIVCKQGKYGVVDRIGTMIVPFEYDHISDYSEGLAEVELNGLSGFIDAHGKVVVPIEYDAAGLFSSGVAAVMKDDLWGYVNSQGEVCVPLKYRFLSWMHDTHLALATMPGGERELFGLIDDKGHEVLPFKYEYVDLSHDGYMYCYREVDGQCTHFVNLKSGTSFVVPGDEVYVRFPVDDTPCFGYSMGTRWGLMSREGKVILRPKYDSMPFRAREGLFCVGNRDTTRRRKSGRHFYNRGMINAKGREVVPLIYDELEYSAGGLAVARYRGIPCVIDKNNHLVIANGVSMGMDR